MEITRGFWGRGNRGRGILVPRKRKKRQTSPGGFLSRGSENQGVWKKGQNSENERELGVEKVGILVKFRDFGRSKNGQFCQILGQKWSKMAKNGQFLGSGRKNGRFFKFPQNCLGSNIQVGQFRVSRAGGRTRKRAKLGKSDGDGQGEFSIFWVIFGVFLGQKWSNFGVKMVKNG